MSVITRIITTCRVCDSPKLTPIFSLGELYISDFLSEAERGEAEKAPMELVLCNKQDGGCGLLQLKHTVSSEAMYRRYWYRSGTNATMTNELRGIAEKVESLVDFRAGDYVIDIGANDGTLLRGYKNPGIYTTGFEPAKNLAEYNSVGTKKIINDFFNVSAWQKEFGDKKAKAITAIAMFYDLDDPNAFVRDVVRCLDDEGVFIIQMSYLPSMLSQNEVGNICHEHLEYYSLLSLEHLLQRHGLEVFDVELNDINGGSFRIYMRNAGKGNTIRITPGAEERVASLREAEKKLGLDNRMAYEEFVNRVDAIKEKLTCFIKEEVEEGKKVYVYGASTKGNTLLQYCGLDSKLITAAAERNPIKWGKKTVGTNIPIISEEQARREHPDYFLVLPWHFLKEFKERESEYFKKGGKFIVPMPNFSVIGEEMHKKKALITGITGQDGSYLAELLLEKGYEVHGLVRRVSTFNRERIQHLFPDVHDKKNRIYLHYGDLTDASVIDHLVEALKPDEIYNLGAQSHVGISFNMPEFTGDVTGLSSIRLLEAIKNHSPKSKLYQASSSEMFGLVQEVPQKETTPFHPRSPYGVAKVYAHWATVNYRESYGIFACNGILFNHESPRRGENFVSRKITLGLAQIMAGKLETLYLGNLDAKRDWGYAKDYVEGMWRMLQQPVPEDYVLATNQNHSVREFVEEACSLLGIDLMWEGEGKLEKGIDKKTGKTIIAIDPRYFRPAEVETLLGDYSKAKEKLGWSPRVDFKELVRIMLESDCKLFGVPIPLRLSTSVRAENREIKKKALITGITGQDGSYLAEFLIEKGYEVHGLTRELPRESNAQKFYRINNILAKLILHEGDVTDAEKMQALIKEIMPDEVYDLAAIVDPLVSLDTEFKILNNNIGGAHNLLGAIKEYAPKAKFYFASSSLVFGNPKTSPQNEETPRNPITPYGIAKAAGNNLVAMYRDVYGIFACSGILYNHESPRRDTRFLPRKITKAAARIKKGLQQELILGDLDAMRDWGYAGDYAESMWLMLQRDKPEDYVIGTGEAHSVKDILEIAFGKLGLDWRNYVKVDNNLVRAKESHVLVADIRKIKNKLGWSPRVAFADMIAMMVEEDMRDGSSQLSEFKIKLIKSAFLKEYETRKKLAEFVMSTERFSMAEECKKFEETFAKKQGRRFAVFVNSGSSANLILIQALLNVGRLKKGDRIGISSITWSTNVMPLIQLGLRPVAIDSELSSLNVSPRTLAKEIDRLQGLFLTNVLGFSDDIAAIKKMCAEKNVVFIEDNCESLGSKMGGVLLGNFGLASTFSLFLGHHISALEGGMICTDDEELCHAMVIARAHGWDRNLPAPQKESMRAAHGANTFYALYTFYDLGYNVRPTEINGFLGNIQIAHWDEIVEKREKNFMALHAILRGNDDFIPLDLRHMDAISNFAVPVLAKNQEIGKHYQEKFRKAGVEIRPIIAGNISSQPFYKKYIKEENECPNALFIHENGFYCGNNSELTKEEVVFLGDLLKR